MSFGALCYATSMDTSSHNPFEAPRARIYRPANEIRPVEAWQTAWRALNARPYELVVVSGGATLASYFLGFAAFIIGLAIFPWMAELGLSRAALLATGSREEPTGEAVQSKLFSGFFQLRPALSLLAMAAVLDTPGRLLGVDDLPPAAVDALMVLTLIMGVVQIRWALAAMYVADQGLSAVDAARASWRATAGQWLTMFTLYLMAVPVFLVGLLTFVIGLWPAYVLFDLALAAVYHQVTSGRAVEDGDRRGDG